ncbi:MAG TPA: sialidase family protein, partial [Thermoanaerobaculia bacterium]
MAFARHLSRFVVVSFLFACVPAIGYAQYAEQNVNMVSGQTWPGGDPFLRQQNEPSLAVSTRNPLHLLAGANDYRSVDIPFNAPARPDDEETGDAWLGVFRSKDGGNTWSSTLLDGYPQLTNSTSPLKGFQAAADPVVRAGNNGMFYYAGIVLNRGSNPLSGVFVARFIDNNNTYAGDPVGYLDTKVIDKGTAGQFIDKPWFAVAPMTNGGQCSVNGQVFPAQNLYLGYSVFVGNDQNIRTKIMFTKSADCGATWSSPTKLSESYTVNQGASTAVDPTSGAVYVAWRRFHGGNDPDSIIIAKSTNAGATFTKGSVAANIT